MGGVELHNALPPSAPRTRHLVLGVLLDVVRVVAVRHGDGRRVRPHHLVLVLGGPFLPRGLRPGLHRLAVPLHLRKRRRRSVPP